MVKDNFSASLVATLHCLNAIQLQFPSNVTLTVRQTTFKSGFVYICSVYRRVLVSILVVILAIHTLGPQKCKILTKGNVEICVWLQ